MDTEKTFVLDTNVILYDHTCIYHFQENDIVIPLTVLEEIDQFKKGNELINFQAREFIRNLDTISGTKLFDKGISLGKNLGTIRIEVEHSRNPDLKDIFMENKPDNRILSVAYTLQQKYPQKQIILVSKDVNLRMKTKSLGIVAQDYKTGKTPRIEELYKGKTLIEDFDIDIINQLYQAPFEIDILSSGIENYVPNQYYILRNKQRSAIVHYNPETNMLEKVDKKDAYGIMPRNAEQTFALHALTQKRIELVTLSGKAGTGKTLLALASAIAQSSQYRQIYLARPIVPSNTRDVGYLPGDIKAKLDPYMQPLFDNLKVIQEQFPEKDSKYKKITEMLEKEKLFIVPLAYIRGRSLNKVFFIVDEAQNLTPHEVKTIITRAGEGTKVIFTGDLHQIDTPYLDSQSNGLSYLIDKMKGQNLYGHIRLEKGERSRLAELASNLL